MTTGALPGLDVASFDTWLRTTHPELSTPVPITAELITGGRSNLTYRIDGATVPLVLRRPPLSHVQPTAHDMGREFRVISALAGSAVPVPATYALVDDPAGGAGTGSPFYLMARVSGEAICTARQNAQYSPGELRTVSLELAGLLAALHQVDPPAVGLADFGRPEGFLERQVRRWGRQYEGSKSRAVPALDQLGLQLAATLPVTSRNTLVHGDFRLDNALVARTGDGPRISAVLDWEMATLGDPLVDLGLLGVYWEVAALATAGTQQIGAVDPAAGYPSFDEMVATYAERIGSAVPDLSWYRAFAGYKLAVILEGIHFRFTTGGTVGAGFDTIGQLVAPLAEDGLARLTGLASTAGRN